MKITKNYKPDNFDLFNTKDFGLKLKKPYKAKSHPIT